MQPFILDPQSIFHLYRKNLVYVSNKNIDHIGACNYWNLIENDNIIAIKDLQQYNVFIILKHESWHIPNLDLLKKIIDACKTDIKKIAVINYNILTLSEQDFLKLFNAKFLVFDIHPSEFFITDNIEWYIEYQKNLNKNIFVFSESLHSLHNPTESKKKLWMSLKKIFNL